MSEWQPIETAPKDGTEIIVVGNNFGDRCQGIHVYVAKYDGGFFYQAEDFSYNLEHGHYLEHLTHWMPLPEPPK